MNPTRAFLAAIAAAVVASASLDLGAFAQDRMSNLISDAATPVVESPGDKLAVARRRSISFSEAGVAALKNGRDVRLNLFADVSLPVLVDKAWQSHIDTWHWQGHVPGAPARTVLMVLHQGHIWGTINAPGVGDFRFRSHRDQGQVVEEFRQDEFHPCGCGIEQSQGHRPKLDLPIAPQNAGQNEGGLGGLAGNVENCAGPIIDVMVVYSPEAALEEGGPGAMVTLINGLEDATNLSYENSLVSQRIRVVHIAETGSEGVGFSATLNNLTNSGDGFYDEVHALRNTHGADLVAMLISHTNGGICGIGWLMGSDDVSPDFEPYGFTVTNTGCATGGFTFQHELGHNMGCHHDHDNAGGSPAFPWSYGHRFDGDDAVQYRTIMSYFPGTRIGWFSNPVVLYQGQPTGVPQGTPGTQADNAASLNATASSVAAFRSSAPLAGSTTWPAPSLLSAGDPNADDRFGVASAISGDLAIIGAYTDDEAVSNAGAAYVFKFNTLSGFWEQDVKLMAPDAANNDRFGVAVDILDGPGASDDLAIVGSYLDDDAGRECGSAYVFRRLGGAGSWAFEFKIKSSDLAGGDSFGRGVAITSGGGSDLVCVGAPGDDDGASAAGSAYIFRKIGAGAWTQELKMVSADPGLSDSFGQSVDIEIAPNGTQYAIAGNWRDDNGADNAGSASVYRKVGAGAWTALPKLVANDAALEDQAGFSVALSFPDATTVLAIVGAWKANAPSSNTGAAYVFADSGLGFVQDIKLVASDFTSESNFGISVDAHVGSVIVGAYTNNAGALSAGAAYIFRRDGVSWSEETKLVSPTPAENDQMGFSVAINGQRAFAGAWLRDAVGGTPIDIGGVWLSGGTGGPTISDCNKNGIDDICDIATGTSDDDDENGIPDECEAEPCPADTNGDQSVNVTDLLAVIGAWGACVSPPIGCAGDVAPAGPPQGDGNVNVTDLLAIISAWGNCP